MSLDELDRRLAGLDGPVSGLPVGRAALVRASIDDIRQAIAANPTHPVALVYDEAIRDVPPRQDVAVDRIDMLGLRTNRRVLIHRSNVAGELHISKTLGESFSPDVPLSAPVSTPLSSAPPPSTELTDDDTFDESD